MKKVFSVILACVMLFLLLLSISGCLISSLAEEDPVDEYLYEVNQSGDLSEEFLENQRKALGAYSALLRSFKNSPENQPKKDPNHFDLSVDRIYSAGFPDYYGGAYVNAEGNLVVMIAGRLSKKEIAEVEQQVKSLCKTDRLIFRKTRYSYSDLMETMAELVDYLNSENYPAGSILITGLGIRDNQNKVVVYTGSTLESDYESIRRIVRYPDSLLFQYREGGLDVPSSTEHCGTQGDES